MRTRMCAFATVLVALTGASTAYAGRSPSPQKTGPTFRVTYTGRAHYHSQDNGTNDLDCRFHYVEDTQMSFEVRYKLDLRGNGSAAIARGTVSNGKGERSFSYTDSTDSPCIAGSVDVSNTTICTGNPNAKDEFNGLPATFGNILAPRKKSKDVSLLLDAPASWIVPKLSGASLICQRSDYPALTKLDDPAGGTGFTGTETQVPLARLRQMKPGASITVDAHYDPADAKPLACTSHDLVGNCTLQFSGRKGEIEIKRLD